MAEWAPETVAHRKRPINIDLKVIIIILKMDWSFGHLINTHTLTQTVRRRSWAKLIFEKFISFIRSLAPRSICAQRQTKYYTDSSHNFFSNLFFNLNGTPWMRRAEAVRCRWTQQASACTLNGQFSFSCVDRRCQRFFFRAQCACIFGWRGKRQHRQSDGCRYLKSMADHLLRNWVLLLIHMNFYFIYISTLDWNVFTIVWYADTCLHCCQYILL